MKIRLVDSNPHVELKEALLGHDIQLDVTDVEEKVKDCEYDLSIFSINDKVELPDIVKTAGTVKNRVLILSKDIDTNLLMTCINCGIKDVIKSPYNTKVMVNRLVSILNEAKIS